MSDEHWGVFMEHHDRLFWQIDLRVVSGPGIRPPWAHHLRVLHTIPDRWGDLAGDLCTFGAEDQLLECPDRLLGQRAEDPVDRAGNEVQISEALLDDTDLVTGHPLAESGRQGNLG